MPIEKKKTIQFDLPDSSLTIGDLVGRAARFVRANFRLIFELYLIPMTVYVFFWELLFWISNHLFASVTGDSNPALDPRVFLLGLCILSIWFCIWWLRVKTLALWLLMTNSEDSVESALKRARDYRMFWIYLPTVFIELTEAVWSTLLLIFMSQAETSKSATAALQITGMYFAVLILWVLPFRMLTTLNLFPAYNILVSEQSIGKGFAKFWFYCRRAPLTLLFATVAVVIVLNSIELPSLLPSTIAGALQASQIMSKDLVEWLELMPRLVIESLIGVLTAGICATFIVLVDNQLKIELEGQDVTARLERFMTKYK